MLALKFLGLLLLVIGIAMLRDKDMDKLVGVLVILLGVLVIIY